MYSKEILPGIDLYLIMLCIAAISAILVYRYIADRRSIGARLQNLCLFNAVASILIGYYSAVLFQAIYNIPKYGEFRLDSNTGATFYGGLIGGAAFFILIYFVVGGFIFKESKEHIRSFRLISDIAAPCIAIAHSFGRLGCLFAGCCHGKETDMWYGIYMSSIGKRVVPIQLYEAIFLAVLFVYLSYRVLKGKTYNLPIYMTAYGLWRFFIEYARDDYRGYTFTDFLTPSQLTAILMIIGAGVVFAVEYICVKRSNCRAEANEADD
ncbi:MAG: prolipoprotein diacylglyceryl transferase [Clostridia bacterium]|nr:prolipoprotein diacylglyceryl transferase [Clostridia bacterium]